MDRELDGLLSGSGSEINLLAVSRVKRMGSMSTVVSKSRWNEGAVRVSLYFKRKTLTWQYFRIPTSFGAGHFATPPRLAFFVGKGQEFPLGNGRSSQKKGKKKVPRLEGIMSCGLDNVIQSARLCVKCSTYGLSINHVDLILLRPQQSYLRISR